LAQTAEASGTHPRRAKLTFVRKVWGREVWLINTDKYCAKYLYLDSGYQSSLHRHLVKDETFLVLAGSCELEIGTETRLLEPNDRAHIAPGIFHRFRNHGPMTCAILEVSTHHDDADTERKEASRKIVEQ